MDCSFSMILWGVTKTRNRKRNGKRKGMENGMKRKRNESFEEKQIYEIR